MPILTLQEAGKQIAAIARSYNFSFFEHWPSDRSGHRGSMEDAVEHLEIIDQALGGLLDDWDDANDLLIITSDHGNIEEKNHRQHSRNPVPTIIIGPDHDALSEKINSLTDIASVIRTFLQLKLAQRSN
jgi:bisphosphoglycerate-independent phosphoglycerate mutase (AlkP superfamily)